jgi:RNA polymerase sigma factor for flagellar operon FliA
MRASRDRSVARTTVLGRRENSLDTKAETAPKNGKAKGRERSRNSDEVELLWATYRKRPCDATRNTLVEAYQSLVKDVVRRFAMRLPRSVDRGDLVTAANVGLISAVEGFDPDRGVRFESYCELRTKGALLDELRTQDWLPRPWRHRVEQQKKTYERLRGALAREPSDDEVAESMSIPLDQYQSLFGTGLPTAPTGSMPTGDDDGAPALDVVPDRNSEAPDEKLTRDELLQLVAQKLTEQEYRIVYLKYWEDLSMKDIGELTELSESRVCKIHARLIERLRDRFRVDVLE